MIDDFEIPITVLKSNFEIIIQNKVSRDLFGEVTGKKCHEVYHGLNSPPSFCRILAFLRGDRTWEDFYEQKIGAWLMAKVTKINVEGKDLFLHIVVDISKLKQKEH